MLPEAVFEDGKELDLTDMEMLSFTVGDASFELEIPSVLMKMCELRTESDRASIVMDTGAPFRRLICDRKNRKRDSHFSLSYAPDLPQRIAG